MTTPEFFVREICLHERDVRLRMPFRFGVVTLTEAPQCYVRARIEFPDGRTHWGAAAEILAPKWFDKDPSLSNEQNFDQLRLALGLAAQAYVDGTARSAFGHAAAHYDELIASSGARKLNPLVACFGPAQVDRAILDALCGALGVSVYEAMRKNLAGIDAKLLPTAASNLSGFDLSRFLSQLSPASSIAARHTVGLVDVIAGHPRQVNDGLPESLEEVIASYGNTYFKLKVGGHVDADIERLVEIASVIDGIKNPYHVTLDGNEQYDDVDAVLSLWTRMKSDARLKRLVASTLFIEQPIKRTSALSKDVSSLSREKPVIVDESDDSLAVFPQARALGYSGVSSKCCKGLYKSILNAARCNIWNSEGGETQYFMSGEDLTTQAGLGVQQDLALVNLLGLTHVERNGHHYVNGMSDLPHAEQARFLEAHPDLYEKSHGAVRLAIRGGRIALGSLDRAGFGTSAYPDWAEIKTLTSPA